MIPFVCLSRRMARWTIERTLSSSCVTMTTDRPSVSFKVMIS